MSYPLTMLSYGAYATCLTVIGPSRPYQTFDEYILVLDNVVDADPLSFCFFTRYEQIATLSDLARRVQARIRAGETESVDETMDEMRLQVDRRSEESRYRVTLTHYRHGLMLGPFVEADVADGGAVYTVDILDAWQPDVDATAEILWVLDYIVGIPRALPGGETLIDAERGEWLIPVEIASEIDQPAQDAMLKGAITRWGQKIDADCPDPESAHVIDDLFARMTWELTPVSQAGDSAS